MIYHHNQLLLPMAAVDDAVLADSTSMEGGHSGRLFAFVKSVVTGQSKR